jgi:hypothetical protein
MCRRLERGRGRESRTHTLWETGRDCKHLQPAMCPLCDWRTRIRHWQVQTAGVLERVKVNYEIRHLVQDHLWIVERLGVEECSIDMVVDDRLTKAVGMKLAGVGSCAMY